MQDTGETPPGISEEMTEEELEEVFRDFRKRAKQVPIAPVPKESAPMHIPLNDYSVLLEQINLLRDLLAGKNNWLDDAIKQERARNEKLLAENAALRKEAERLRLGLVEALTIDYRADDSNIDASTFNPLWELTRV